MSVLKGSYYLIYTEKHLHAEFPPCKTESHIDELVDTIHVNSFSLALTPPYGLVCIRKTSVRYFSAQITRLVNKKLIIDENFSVNMSKHSQPL